MIIFQQSSAKQKFRFYKTCSGWFYLSVCVSILTTQHGAHRSCVRSQSGVKTQTHQTESRQLTLQLCYQVLLVLQFITLK